MSTHPYTVAVGVSETSGSPVALRWAREQAARLDGRVVAVRAYQAPPPTSAHTPPASLAGHDPEVLRDDALRRLAEAVATALGSEDAAELQVVEGDRREVLASASHAADLLVVDAPGSMSTRAGDPISLRKLVAEAQCPVVVMPRTIAGSEPSWLARAARRIGSEALHAAGTAGRPGLPPLAR